MGYISAEVAGDHVRVWERQDGQRICRIFPAPAEFYIPDPNGNYVSMFGDRLQKLQFNSIKKMRSVKRQLQDDGVKLFESDISPAIKVLSQHYFNVEGGKINTTFLDIENDYDPAVGYATMDNPYAPINAISMYHQWLDKSIVLAVPPPGFDMSTIDPSLHELSEIKFFDTEAELLQEFLMQIEDSDALCGWNSRIFDFPYIAKRLERLFGAAEVNRLCFPDASDMSWGTTILFKKTEVPIIRVGGRILADYMNLYKKFIPGEKESYKLEAIAEEHLPELPKLSYERSLYHLYHHDFNHFLRYNVRDTEILKGFERVLGFMDLAVLIMRDATGLFDNVTGTVRLADYSIMNYNHYTLNVICPDLVEAGEDREKLKGAHVLDPIPGMHEYIGSVDVSSLYPSCIRSVNISPEVLVGQFLGTWDDVQLMYEGSDTPIRFQEEATGAVMVEPASTWRDIFDKNNCAISGYGTVFDMSKQGILPTILEGWYNQRVDVNAEIDQLDAEIAAITSKYTPVKP